MLILLTTTLTRIILLSSKSESISSRTALGNNVSQFAACINNLKGTIEILGDKLTYLCNGLNIEVPDDEISPLKSNNFTNDENDLICREILNKEIDEEIKKDHDNPGGKRFHPYEIFKEMEYPMLK
jgi:hypothetical protein